MEYTAHLTFINLNRSWNIQKQIAYAWQIYLANLNCTRITNSWLIRFLCPKPAESLAQSLAWSLGCGGSKHTYPSAARQI